MKKIVLLGVGPLPIENPTYIYSSSNRTWHLAKGLLDEGHRVHVVAFRPARTMDGVRIPDPELRSYSEGAFSLDSVDEIAHFWNDSFLRDRVLARKPDAVVGVNTFPATRAAETVPELPLWADLNGFHLGEFQIRAHSIGTDKDIPFGRRLELTALRRADVFSAASRRQRYAVIGDLAALGRLRGVTCGYEFVHVVPNGRDDLPPSEAESPLKTHSNEGDVAALWIGCYNYQFDVDTLFEGFERAMAKEPRLHFVSTGGRVDGHNEITFDRFKSRVDASPYRDRYRFLGWLDWPEFDSLMRTSAFGVTVDVPCYETEIGARNRLTEMTRVGLPAVTTFGPEIAEDLVAAGGGWGVPPNDPDALAEALLAAARNPEERRLRGERARRLFEERYTIPTSAAPLLRWARDPWTAPDKGLDPIDMNALIGANPTHPAPKRGGLWERIRGK